MTSVLTIKLIGNPHIMRRPIAKRSHRTTTILRLNGAAVNGTEPIERWIIRLVKDWASQGIPCAGRDLMPAFHRMDRPDGAVTGEEEGAMRIARRPSLLVLSCSLKQLSDSSANQNRDEDLALFEF